MDLNIITAKFCSGATQTWTEEAWQYDYGQVLQFDGLELPEAYQVHFSNTPLTGETITQIGGDDGVTVPDQFFQSGEAVYAWVYLHEGEDDGETVYMVTIPVKKRPQPSEEQPTPVEQSAIDQAIAALNIAVEKADEAITHYPTIIDGTWHVWDVTEEEYVDTGVQAQGQPGADGQDGQDGFSPVITVTDITGGHRVTITDAEGTQSFDVLDGSGAPAFYGVCNSSYGSLTKVVPCDGFELVEGARIIVTFTAAWDTAISSGQMKLNVNGTGAKTIRYRNLTVTFLTGSEHFYGNRTYEFVYDGTYYVVVGDFDTTYSTMTQLEADGGTVTTGKLISAKVLHTAILNAGGGVTVDDELSTTSENPVQNKVITGELNDVKADLSELSETVDGILVEQTIGETVTLTNRNNAYNFYDNSGGTGFKSKSYNDGVVSVINNGGDSEKSPYVFQNTNLGSSTWLVGFKFKFTKLNESLANPEQFRIHMGASTITDYTPVWNEWIEYANIATIDMTRIRVAARNFASVPPSDSFTLEIKDMYVYDVSDVDADMRSLIIAQQNENYQDGTVTYGETSTTTAPDTSLSLTGKAADSKAVGDALKGLNGVRNAKDYGVVGDGSTDDTTAINTMLALGGTFYFPPGTYKITGTIELPEGSVLYGDGDTTVIDMHNCTNLTECTFRSNDKIYPYILVRNDGVAIRNIKLIGNNTLLQQRHAGIGILDAEKCTVQNVTIYNINYDPTQDNDATVSGYGICVTRSNYIAVERCHVQQCGYECIGIVDDCNYCVVKDCYTQDGWRTCIQVHRGSCNTTIQNCYMKQTHTKYDACFTVHGLADQMIKNLRILDCTAECTQNGAQPYDYCAPYQIMSYSEKLSFIGNNAFGGKRAFYIQSSSTNAKIIGNDFQCNSSSDYGVTIGALNTIVVGNYLLNEASTPTNVISNNPVLSANVGIS